MSIPVAYFNYSKSGKVLSFRDLSLNAPTSYLWDFGNGQNSTDKNPTITFIDNGFYVVTLVSSNADGDSESLGLQIGVGETNETLNIPLLELVNQYIPDSIVGYSTNTEKINLIHKWQTYLQPLCFIPFEVAEEDTHNEFAWPLLVNTMLAMLVAHDLMKILAYRGMTSLITGLDTSSESSSVQSGVKSITTGPTEVEFHSNQEESKTLANIFDGQDSGSQQLVQGICNLSQRVRIYLPTICDALPDIIVPFVLAKSYISQLHWEKWLPLGNYYYPIFIGENNTTMEELEFTVNLVEFVPITLKNESGKSVKFVIINDPATGQTNNIGFTKSGAYDINIMFEPIYTIDKALVTLILI